MVEDFLNYLRFELNRTPLTIEAYRNDLTQFFLWISPKGSEVIDFKLITSSDVRAWLSSLARGGNTSRTLRRKIISLRSFFKWMQKTGKITRSPLLDISLPKISKPLPDIIKPAEIEASISMGKSGEENDNQEVLQSLIIDMLYSLGIRRAELIGINDSDISFSKSEIKVLGKRNKQRIIPVPEILLKKIKDWQKIRNKENYSSGENVPLLLVKGKRITASQVYYIVHKSLASSTARKKSPHALRHSFASGMLNGGAEIDSVKEFLGHSSLSTTQIYTHISLNEIKKAYQNAHPRSEKKG